MSRLRKLSEGAEHSLIRLKHRESSKSIHYSSKKILKATSPYSKLKQISRSPSYLLPQPVQAKSISTVRSKAKNSFRLEDSSLSAGRFNTPWENLLIQARQLKDKIANIDLEDCSETLQTKIFEAFEEVIEKDLIFGTVLVKIKGLYSRLFEKYESQFKELMQKIEEFGNEKQSYVRMLDRLSNENMDLGKEIQKLEANCSGLQGTLDKIRSVSLTHVPIEGDKWKALIYENSQYSALVQDMKMDIREFQYKEDQLIRLIGAIKARGVPVDEIYDEDIRTEESVSRVSESVESLANVRVPGLDLSKIFAGSGKLSD